MSRPALELIWSETTRKWPEETGGVLLGYHSANPGRAVVLHALGPGPEAEHGAQWFRPDDAYHRTQTARFYAESGRTTTYLGDWHTHPGGLPRLSRQDKRTLRMIADNEAARAPAPLMALVAGPTDGPDKRILVWQLLSRCFAGMTVRHASPTVVRLWGTDSQ